MADQCTNAAFPVPQGESMRALLAADRVATLQQISALSREFEGIVEANALVAIDDEHDPEGRARPSSGRTSPLCCPSRASI